MHVITLQHLPCFVSTMAKTNKVTLQQRRKELRPPYPDWLMDFYDSKYDLLRSLIFHIMQNCFMET